jgi:hypothetical protein
LSISLNLAKTITTQQILNLILLQIFCESFYLSSLEQAHDIQVFLHKIRNLFAGFIGRKSFDHGSRQKLNRWILIKIGSGLWKLIKGDGVIIEERWILIVPYGTLSVGAEADGVLPLHFIYLLSKLLILTRI